MFVLASSVSKSLQCLISTLTRGGKGGPLFRLTCSIVMWRGRDTQTNAASMCGECSQRMDHAGFPQRRHALPRLRCSGSSVLCKCTVPCGGTVCPLCFMHFPGLSCSGSRVLRKGTDPDGLCVLCPSQVQATQTAGYLASALSQMDRVS